MALISMSTSTRDFYKALARGSESPISPDESCTFGGTSWIEELDDDAANNFARFATVSSVNSMSARFVKLFMCESHAFRVSEVNIIFMFMTFQHLAICVECHRPQAVLSRETEELSVDIQTCVSDQD